MKLIKPLLLFILLTSCSKSKDIIPDYTSNFEGTWTAKRTTPFHRYYILYELPLDGVWNIKRTKPNELSITVDRIFESVILDSISVIDQKTLRINSNTRQYGNLYHNDGFGTMIKDTMFINLHTLFPNHEIDSAEYKLTRRKL